MLMYAQSQSLYFLLCLYVQQRHRILTEKLFCYVERETMLVYYIHIMWAAKSESKDERENSKESLGIDFNGNWIMKRQ